MDHPDIDTCIREAEIIEKMYMDLLEGTTQKRMKRVDDGSTGLQNVEYRICLINSKNEPLQRALFERYGDWYEACRESIQASTSRSRRSKYDKFSGFNETMLSLIGLKDPVSNSNEKSDLKKEFRASFDVMVSMLNSMEPLPLIASAQNGHERMSIIEQMNSELDEAERLYEQGSVRSAGLIAGDALEIYLRMLCEVNDLEPEPEETMAAMVQRLRNIGRAKELDQEMLETIDYLVVLSDRCTTTDDNDVDLEDGARELIDRVREMIFLAFC